LTRLGLPLLRAGVGPYSGENQGTTLKTSSVMIPATRDGDLFFEKKIIDEVFFGSGASGPLLRLRYNELNQ
jgi:hypothetical protein